MALRLKQRAEVARKVNRGRMDGLLLLVRITALEADGDTDDDDDDDDTVAIATTREAIEPRRCVQMFMVSMWRQRRRRKERA